VGDRSQAPGCACLGGEGLLGNLIGLLVEEVPDLVLLDFGDLRETNKYLLNWVRMALGLTQHTRGSALICSRVSWSSSTA